MLFLVINDWGGDGGPDLGCEKFDGDVLTQTAQSGHVDAFLSAVEQFYSAHGCC